MGMEATTMSIQQAASTGNGLPEQPEELKAAETRRLRVIICGGGIAGFAAALLLREDHDVTILESSLSNEELGAAITLSMNASRLLRSSLARAGFDQVKARYVEAEKFQEVHWKNLSVIHEWQMEAATKKYNQPWWYFSRKDVHHELKRAALSSSGLGATPRLELGATVERVDIQSRKVYLTSGQSFEGDVIIGADGIRSASGNSVFGKLGTESHELSAYRCMIPSAKMRQDPDMAILVDSAKVLMIIGPDRRIVAYPCSSWEYINFVCIFPDTAERRVQWNTKVTVQEMLDKFSDFHPAICKALANATETGVWQLRDRTTLPTLVKGCFALVGDAAHAMGPHQGQGACQAIEDAEALRILLKGATREDAAERLQLYDGLRAKRVAKVIEYTRDAAPKPTDSTEVDDQTTQWRLDFYWGYNITEDTIQTMRRNGHQVKLIKAETGEISLE